MIRAHLDITLETGAMQSQLVAGDSIKMTTGKGQLVGGTAMAGHHIAVRQLGSPSELLTEVSVGLTGRAMKLLTKIDQKRQSTLTSHEECTNLIDRMMRLVRDTSQLDPPSLASLSRLRQVKLVLDVAIANLNARRERVLNVSAKDTSGKVDVIEEVMPKVIVHIGSATMENKQAARHRQFVFDPAQERIVCRALK